MWGRDGCGNGVKVSAKHESRAEEPSGAPAIDRINSDLLMLSREWLPFPALRQTHGFNNAAFSY